MTYLLHTCITQIYYIYITHIYYLIYYLSLRGLTSNDVSKGGPCSFVTVYLVIKWDIILANICYLICHVIISMLLSWTQDFVWHKWRYKLVVILVVVVFPTEYKPCRTAYVSNNTITLGHSWFCWWSPKKHEARRADCSRQIKIYSYDHIFNSYPAQRKSVLLHQK